MLISKCYYKLQVATLINVLVINLLIPTSIYVRACVCVVFVSFKHSVCPLVCSSVFKRILNSCHSMNAFACNLLLICSSVMSLRNEKQYGFAWKRA